MRKNFKWLLALVAMVASVNLMAAETATYIFNTDAGLSALGITKPNNSAGTDLNKDASYKVGEVSMTATHGGTNTRVWNSSGTLDLRIYKSGGTLTFAVSEDYKITQIVLTGGTINVFSVDANCGSYNSSNGTWTPKQGTTATSVVFTATGTGKISTITVTYETNSSSSCEDLNAPSNLSATNISMNGATLSWTGVDNASSYTVMVGETEYKNVTSPYVVSGLDAETKYSWSVQAIGDGETYCSSAVIDGQDFTTLPDPNKKTVTYNFNDANAYPSGFPTSGTNVANAQEFTISGNKIIINAPKSYYEINSTQDASRALFFGQSSTTLASTAYLEFPAFKNYKLTKVVATTGSGVAGSVSINIYNTSWTAVSTAQSTVSSTKKEFTFDIASDKQVLNAAYRLASNSSGSKNLQFDNIVLTYAYVAPQSYNVTLTTNPASVGTITAKVDNVVIGEKVEEGKTVTLTAAPNDAHAYRFKEWQSSDVEIEDNAFEMPGKAVSITAVFEPLYAISVTTAGEGSGTATINGGTETIYVSEDDEITLVAEAAAGSEFGGWTASNENIIFDNASSASTTALAGAAGTITATFGVSALLPLDAPTLSAPTNITYNSVTLNWQELANAEGGYYVEIWLDDVRVAFESGIGDNYWTLDPIFQANTTYTYTVQGIGDGSTYAEENNPKATSTFTTADYPAATLTLSENGVETPLVGKLNTPITLPTESTQACEGKVFMGWSANEIDGETDVEPSLLGTTYTFTDPEQLTKTIYAVYAKEQKGSTSWNIATSIVAGEVIVFSTNTSSDYRYTAQTIASNIMPCAASTYSDDKSQITTLGDGTQQYTVGGNSENGFTFATAGGYLYISADKKVDVKNTATTWTCSINGTTKVATISQKYSSDTYYLKFNPNVQSGVSTNPRFTVYKSGQQDIVLYKKTTSASTYSKYCTTCEAAIAVPTFSLDEGEYDEAKTLMLSAAEGDIYYTINDGTETKYTAAIALNNRGTYEISAYAKVGDRTSETVTKTYTLDWAYTLAELVAEGEPTSTGRTVTVILTNEVIESLATSGSYVNGFFTMVGDKKIEVYCQNSPAEWEVGGKVSGTVTCPWKDYKGTWELCPTNWNWASYTAPAKITSLVINNDVTNKNYTAGQKLDFAGLTVTGVYSDATEEDVTEDVVWTEVTLTENQTAATATATLNNAKTGNIAVSQSKSITGLTVGAAKTLVSIYVADDSEHKTAFFVGRPFSAEGLIVMAHYNMGDDQQIALANLTIDNPTFSAAEAEHTINIAYTENEVEKSTSYKVSVGYMNLSDLVAEDIPTNTSVKVAFSNVEIIGFYKNSSDKRAGVYVNVIGKNGSNIELYSSGTPSATLNDWQEGGKLASKGNYISGTWKYYDGNDVWEIDFGSAYAWSTNIEYTAPEIYPTEISMSIPIATVKQSKSLDLEANFTPANATVLNNLEWSSDNNQVTVVPSQDKKSAKVTVAPDATVGTATITVKVDDKDGNKLSATCVITIQEYSVPHYGLYSGAIEGGDYIFKANGQNYYMNNTNNNGRLANVANESNPEIVNNIITTDAETYVWQIAKSGDYWTIQNLENSKYVSSTAKSSAGLVDDATANTALWTITYDATNEVYTFVNLGRSQAASDADKCYLRNNNNNGWACYASGTGNAITLYKAGFTPAAALQSIEIKGDLEITEYFQGKSVKYDGLTVEGTYSDGDKKTITEGIVWSASPASFSDLGAQTVTITATVTTKSGEVTDDAEFNVTVVESQQVNYGLVTNVATLYDGATIILGAVFGTDATPIYAVNQGFESKYLKAYRSNDPNGSDLEYENEVMKTAYASEITLKKVEGGWKLLGEDGKYINGAGDLSQTTDVAEATVWTISIEDGVAKIASGSNIIYYNTSSPRFKTYTSAQQEIGIYMKEVERETLRENLENGKMYSYCPAYDLALVEGAIFYQPDYMDAAYVHFVEVTEIKAGYGYILEGKGEALKAVQVGEEVTTAVAADADNTRGMQGVLKGNANYDINGENEGYQFPATSYSQALVSNNHLQYVGKDNVIIVGRAYLDLDIIADLTAKDEIQYPGLRRVAINFGGQAPTNLNGLNGNMKAAKVLRDGQLYIIREAKTYNAQGIEVQ